MRPIIEETGKVYGSLTVIKFAEQNKHGQAVWECLCDCGETALINGSHLRHGRKDHCGCKGTPMMRNHGLSQNVIYSAYRNAHFRCTNPKAKQWLNYGGRGIQFKLGTGEEFVTKMTESWFVGASLGRIDNNGHYEYENLRWETARQQTSNMRSNVFYTYEGRTLILSDWARELNVCGHTVKNKVNQLGVDLAFSSMLQKRRELSLLEKNRIELSRANDQASALSLRKVKSGLAVSESNP